jgi:transcriptional regulator with XRE-family HTH domain
MITVLGKFLRKLRLDNDEILADMGEKIGVSSAYLSSIENGKKNLPKKYINIIAKKYNLNNDEVSKLEKFAELSKKEVKLNLKNMDQGDRDIAYTFARKFNSISEEDKKKLREILNI